MYLHDKLLNLVASWNIQPSQFLQLEIDLENAIASNNQQEVTNVFDAVMLFDTDAKILVDRGQYYIKWSK